MRCISHGLKVFSLFVGMWQVIIKAFENTLKHKPETIAKIGGFFKQLHDCENVVIEFEEIFEWKCLEI